MTSIRKIIFSIPLLIVLIAILGIIYSDDGYLDNLLIAIIILVLVIRVIYAAIYTIIYLIHKKRNQEYKKPDVRFLDIFIICGLIWGIYYCHSKDIAHIRNNMPLIAEYILSCENGICRGEKQHIGNGVYISPIVRPECPDPNKGSQQPRGHQNFALIAGITTDYIAATIMDERCVRVNGADPTMPRIYCHN